MENVPARHFNTRCFIIGLHVTDRAVLFRALEHVLQAGQALLLPPDAVARAPAVQEFVTAYLHLGYTLLVVAHIAKRRSYHSFDLVVLRQPCRAKPAVFGVLVLHKPCASEAFVVRDGFAAGTKHTVAISAPHSVLFEVQPSLGRQDVAVGISLCDRLGDLADLFGLQADSGFTLLVRAQQTEVVLLDKGQQSGFKVLFKLILAENFLDNRCVDLCWAAGAR
mmetsp:Transcript_20284/g.40190  ORF Transcript_20284/g.40190 Transcript_20284/m.40190 type:complete len:222 (-) Transcript_20284:78-743(-)